MILKDKILRAMRADSIPEGKDGLWIVNHQEVTTTTRIPGTNGEPRDVPPGKYVHLWRFTMATMHMDPLAEMVMNDIESELRKHLDFCLRAHGMVLVTGLGLGCVLRGLLVNPAVRHVLVIERDPAVIRLVAPHLPQTAPPRHTIVEADARTWCKEVGITFDCAWHDIWSDPDKDEEHLQVAHGQMMAAMRDKVKFQGAWNFPRFFRRIWPTKLI